MRSVLALIGSQAGQEGHTALIASQLIENLQKVAPVPIQSEILTADNWHLNSCLSCDHCFYTGTCARATQDDLQKIQEKILACDLLILGSPVFAAHISGDLKTLLDRLAVWLHVMPLIGKFAIPLCTTSSNHADVVISYLTEMLEYMGTSVPTAVSVYRHKGSVLFHEKDKLQAYLLEKAQVIANAMQMSPSFSTRQESYFKLQSLRYQREIKFSEIYPGLMGEGEASKWCEQGYGSSTSIQEVIKRK